MNKTALHILGIVAVAALTSACGSGAPQSDYNPDSDEGGSLGDGGADGGSTEMGGQPNQGGETNEGGQGGEPPETDCAPGGQKSCYDGDPATIGVGLCQEGISTCEPDGFWGACTDQVLPSPEDCSGLGDEDCDGSACSDPLWAVQLYATGDSRISDVVVGADGSIYLAGKVQGTVSLGGQTLTALSNNGNALVAKLDASGSLVWSRLASGTAKSDASALTLDPQGDVLVVGSFGPGFDAGGGVIAHEGGGDMYIARYDGATGAWQASKYLTMHPGTLVGKSHTGSKTPFDVVVMNGGTIAVVGNYTGDWGCLGFNCTPVGAATDIGSFVRGYSASFIPLWSHTYDEAGWDYMTAAAPLPDGGLVAVGHNAATSARVRHYAATGQLSSEASHGTALANSVSVTANGDRLIAMSQLNGDADVWLKRNGLNSGSWTVPVPGNQHLTSAFEDQDGNIVIAGSYTGATFDLGGGALPATNHSAAFIAKLNPSYQHIWSKGLGGAMGQSSGNGVAAHPSGRIVFDGSFESSTIDFGLGPLTKQSGAPREPFIAMFEP